MKRLAVYLKPFLPRMGMGISFKAVGTLVELAIPWILSYIIDDLIPLKEIRPVCLWGGLMIVCSLIAWGGNITANRMASAVARDCTRQIRHDLVPKDLVSFGKQGRCVYNSVAYFAYDERYIRFAPDGRHDSAHRHPCAAAAFWRASSYP